jgi:hypothetical protein
MNFSDMLHDKSPEKIYSEAFEVYKQLSGIYAGKGLYQDSNKAYEKFKDFEGEYYKERLKRHWKEGAFKESLKDVLALMGIISIWALGYGFKWKAVVIWLMIIVSFWTFVYYISINQRNLLESIHYSLNNSLGANDHFYSVVQGLLPSIESFFGVLLVGFLGFVFANKVRNNA